MAKTGPNFRLSKTTKRMVGLMRGNNEQRNQFKRMMIDAVNFEGGGSSRRERCLLVQVPLEG